MAVLNGAGGSPPSRMRCSATEMGDQDGGLWRGVRRLLDGAVSREDLRMHGLELLALERWSDLGREVPEEFVVQARMTAMKLLAAPLLLQRVREASGWAAHASEGARDGRILS